ncbi:MAG: ATP-binding protein [Bacteroidia bacterium]|nr:ATP-binding protein [Bacteroidia bacterium]
MRLCLFLLFLITSTYGYCQVDVLSFEQEKQLQELLAKLNNKPEPETLEHLSNELEFLTLRSQIPLARLKYYLVESRKIAQKNKTLNKLEYRIYYISGMLDYLLGDSLAFKKKTENIRQELILKSDYKALVSMNIAISGFYGFKKKSDLALKGYLENEVIFNNQLKDELKSGTILNCISNANNLGFLYQEINKLDSAIYYFNLGLQRAKDYKNETWIGIISGNIGSCHFDNGHFDFAEPLLITDVTLSLKQNQPTSAINAILSLVEIELKRGRPHEAQKWLDKATDILNHIDPVLKKLIDQPYFPMFKQLEGEIAIQLGNAKLGVEAFREALDSLKQLNAEQTSANEEFLAKRYIIEKNLMVINSLEEQQTRKNLYLAIGVILVLSLAFFLWRQQVFNKNLKEKNQEIECQAKELEKLNLEKNRLFSIVAHDLRSPVANLNNLLEMQSDYYISKEEFVQYSKDISKSLKSLNSMLENILHWAKASMDGGIVPELKLQSPADLIQQIIDQSKPLLDAKNQICEFINSNPSSWSFDSNLLSVVLRNLLHNAIKFSPTGSTIRIQTTLDGTRNLIQITDQGIGMDSYQLNKLVEGTVAKPGVGTSGEKGTGLGMRISKEFLDAMSAKLQASSELGKGTQFDLVFPNQDK